MILTASSRAVHLVRPWPRGGGPRATRAGASGRARGARARSPTPARELSTPVPMSSTRSKPLRSVAVARLKGSSSTKRRMIDPSVAFDDRLPGPGQAVGVLGIHDRPRLVEPVEDHAGVVGRRALLRRPADAQVAVAHREDRFVARQVLRGEAPLGDLPVEGRSRRPSPRGRRTTTSAPAERSIAAAWRRARRRSRARSRRTRPAATPATASSTTTACARRDAQALGGEQEAVRSRLAAQARAASTSPPPIVTSKRPLDAGRVAARHRRSRSRTRRPCAGPGRATARTQRTEPGNASTPSAASACSTSACLRSPMSRTVSGVGSMPRDRRRSRTPSWRGLPSTWSDVVALDVERLGASTSSNVCFQHAACSAVVEVRTPSRSNRTAS